jgi:peptide/nickel transport system permease protein
VNLLRLRIGAIAALLLLLFGFVSIVWTPFPVTGLNIGSALQDPGAGHWLGTDQLGRDVFSLLMKSILTSFVVAGVAAAIGAFIGIPIGLAAANLEGPASSILITLSEFPFAFQALVIGIVMAAAFGPGTPTVMLAAGIFSIPAFARATRDVVVALRGLDYIDAARLAGMNGTEIGRRHLIPDLSRLLIALAVEVLATAIIAEAIFSYVGIGTQAPAASLGLMLRDAQAYALSKPVFIIAPGITILIAVIALNTAAHGLRGLLDPRIAQLGTAHGVA